MITLNPIGIAYNERYEIEDDYWGEVISRIVLDNTLPEEALYEIESFSHLEIIFHFHMVDKNKIITVQDTQEMIKVFLKLESLLNVEKIDLIN